MTVAQIECYENYPLSIVFLSNAVSIAIYLIGGFLIFQLGLIWLFLYILFILLLEVRLLRRSCTNCYYYGNLCAFGKGRISAIFFEKGDAKRFTQDAITWKAILPDFLVFIIPLIVGIALLIMAFDLLILVLVVLLAILATIGNGYIRGSFACKYCRQREIGCPAEKLFSKGN